MKSSAKFRTSRDIPATLDQIFDAFRRPERLARWWGPEGFSNTFKSCDFRDGGAWSFVMHGPDGRDYPNENVFEEIQAPRRVVIRHVSEPKYRLTIEMTASETGTLVSWSQEFDNPEVAARISHIVAPANEQNLDRLAAETVRHSG